MQFSIVLLSDKLRAAAQICLVQKDQQKSPLHLYGRTNKQPVVPMSCCWVQRPTVRLYYRHRFERRSWSALPYPQLPTIVPSPTLDLRPFT